MFRNCEQDKLRRLLVALPPGFTEDMCEADLANALKHAQLILVEESCTVKENKSSTEEDSTSGSQNT